MASWEKNHPEASARRLTIESAAQREALSGEFLGYALAQAHPLVRAWAGGALEGTLRDGVERMLDLTSDEAEAQRFHDVMPLPGVPVSSYMPRLVEIDGIRLVASIDSPDADANGVFAPFIFIWRASTPLGSVDNWQSLRRAFAETFVEFRPRSVQFFHPAHLPLVAPTSEIDDRVLMAPARMMVERPKAEGIERITLRRSDKLDFYPRYEALYRQIFEERPNLRSRVRIEPRDSLGECASQGMLFEIEADGVWSGIVAARQQVVAGVRGAFMVEIILSREARGQRLGAAVHQRMAEAILERDSAAIIHGTIWGGNLASRRAAERAGRIDIGAWYVVHL